MTKGSNEDKVLAYHGVLLRRSDVELLQGPYWLNDQIIDFFWEYLRKEAFPSSSELALIDSSVCYFFVQGGTSDLQVLMKPLQLDTKELILFPVNNSTSVSTAGGTHWSLLVYFKADDRFRHYDSMTGTNANAARAIARAAAAIVGIRSISTAEISHQAAVENVPCLQQQNAYDCGVFVLENAYQICRSHTEGNSQHQLEQALLDLSEDAITTRREYLSRIISQRMVS